MTAGGWIVLVLSVSSVVGLFAWCIWKVLSIPNETEKMHGFEFETPDEKDDRQR